MTDIAETLIKEAKLPKEEIDDEPFAELHRIHEDIIQQNLTVAIAWTNKYSQQLEQRNSPLEFKLHRLAFLKIIQQGRAFQNDAIFYARNYLSRFSKFYQKDFQALMGTLLYLKVGLEHSPYSFLTRDELWLDAADLFLNDASILLGMSKDSSFNVIINAGRRTYEANRFILHIF